MQDPGLVIRQGLIEWAGPKAAVGAAEQKRARRAIQRDGAHRGTGRGGKLATQRLQALQPTEGLFKGCGISRLARRHLLAGDVHHRQPQSAAAQVNA